MLNWLSHPGAPIWWVLICYRYHPSHCQNMSLFPAPAVFEDPFLIWYDKTLWAYLVHFCLALDQPVLHGVLGGSLLWSGHDFWAFSAVRARKYVLFFLRFFFKVYLFILREKERRERIPNRFCTVSMVPNKARTHKLWDHDLSWSQESDA